MKSIVAVLLLSLSLGVHAQTQKTPTLKSILLEQLRTTHNQKDWFVDANTAVAGLTPEQANWKDGSGNHSVGQLAYHLVFWNRQALAKFKGETPDKSFYKDDRLHTVEQVKVTKARRCALKIQANNFSKSKTRSWKPATMSGEWVANIT